MEGPRPVTLLKKRLWHRCFPVSFAKFLKKSFLIEHLWLLVLQIKSKNVYVKWPSRKNYLAYKKTKNKYNETNKDAQRNYFKRVAKDGTMTKIF